MKNKEINLSSASLEKKDDFEEKVLENNKPNEGGEEEKGCKKDGKFCILKEKVKKKLDELKTWWNNAPRKVKILTISIPALLILGGSAFFFYYTIFGPRSRPPELTALDTMIPKMHGTQLERFDPILLDRPSLPRTEESPINGRLFTREEMDELKKRRPIAAIISNHIHARPTSNLHKADVVYEALVEGGITRFVAIYWANEPNKIGSIRSARQYHLEWLSEYDPLFVYDGFAISSDRRVDAAGNIDRYVLRKIYTSGAWRVNERSSPHNQYSSTIRTWEIAENRGWDGHSEVESWSFKNDAPANERVENFKAEVAFSNSANYKVTWEYDKTTNRYLRYIGGVADKDLESGKQISAKNVIIQEVDVEGPVDEYNRLIITTIGSGTAAILRDGEVIYGTWGKDDRESRTKFYDNSGNEINLNRGLTWISAVRHISSDFDIIK